MRACRLMLLALFAFAAQAGLANSPDAPLANTVQEARAQTLFRQLRCVVCQSEALADSPSQMASAMRQVIRDDIAAGKSDDEITDALVARYGDFILMRPPLSSATALLWFTPPLILMLAASLAYRYFRRHTGRP